MNNNNNSAEERAKENEKITAEAHRLAAEARAREANQPPLIQSLAESIKQKLEVLPSEEN